METKIVRIGNSKGLRLSKTILDKYQIKDKVELVLNSDHIILKPISNPREGWIEQLVQMHEQGDDNLMIDEVFEQEDFEEWR